MLTATPSPVAAVTPSPPAGYDLVVSDGSDVVRVAGRAVRFSTTVTDATVSPNGRDLAFVDRLGNIAIAHLDGSNLRPLTNTDPGVRRAQPTFEDGGSEVIFSERGHDGVWRLKEVAADGHDDLTAGAPDPTVKETASDGGHDTSPSATWFQASHDDAANSVLLFEHRRARGVSKVFVADRNQRGFGAYPLLTGRAPAVSPTGDRFAFIGPRGQIEVQALPVTGRRPHPTQITWSAHPTGHLAWTTDGRRIVFSTRRDVESVSSTVDQPGRNPARILLSHPGVASPATLTRPNVGTFAGTDPVGTALAVSRARFVDGTDIPDDESAANGLSWATHVTLVGTGDPAAAAPAAAIAAGGPILFLPDGRLDPRVRDELLRLLQHPRGFSVPVTVDIVGTTEDVPAEVDAAVRGLEGLRVRVRRFAPDAAAADAAAAVRGSNESYVVVSQDDLPAIASSVSAQHPVLLTDGATMPSATAAKLDRIEHSPDAPATVYAVGRDAQAAVRSSWPGKAPFRIVDVGGADPLADSLASVQTLYDAPGRLSVTTDADWRDLLIATMAGPALVVDRQQGLSEAAGVHLADSDAVVRAIYVFGGPAGLPQAIGTAVYGDRYDVRRAPTDILE
ncbi:MAG TPA: hypothetical protein VGK78_06450 [Nocardioides sp.]|uniref:hypothetical protein n=1 Tax=Nocardioides sp. TaxID=35761 RepID=UPI002F3FA1F3